MVRLADLPEYEREHLLAKNLPPLGPLPWHTPTKALSAMRFALITTAGLHFRGEPTFILPIQRFVRSPSTVTQMSSS